MDNIDTGKVRIQVVDNHYLHVEIYTDEEITKGDIPSVTGFLDQFSEPVPALIERRGHYAISILVQIAMMQQTKKRLKAVAYIERNHRDVILTRIAASTYFRDVAVKSFYEEDMALQWLSQFFSDKPLISSAETQAHA
jgi:hypothetical protein